MPATSRPLCGSAPGAAPGQIGIWVWPADGCHGVCAAAKVGAAAARARKMNRGLPDQYLTFTAGPVDHEGSLKCERQNVPVTRALFDKQLTQMSAPGHHRPHHALSSAQSYFLGGARRVELIHKAASWRKIDFHLRILFWQISHDGRECERFKCKIAIWQLAHGVDDCTDVRQNPRWSEDVGIEESGCDANCSIYR